MSDLRNWLLSIVAVFFVSIIMNMLVPEGSIKKMVNLITGLLIILMIVKPLITWMRGDAGVESLIQDTFAKETVSGEIQSSKGLKSYEEQSLIRIYKKNLTNRIKEEVESIGGISCVSVEVQVNEDNQNKCFGEILKIDLVLEANETKSDIKKTRNIDSIDIKINEISPDIKINENDPSTKTINQKDLPDNKMVNEARNKLKNVFSLKDEVIHITIKVVD